MHLSELRSRIDSLLSGALVTAPGTAK
jgi:hypothetical protein